MKTSMYFMSPTGRKADKVRAYKNFPRKRISISEWRDGASWASGWEIRDIPEDRHTENDNQEISWMAEQDIIAQKHRDTGHL